MAEQNSYLKQGDTIPYLGPWDGNTPTLATVDGVDDPYRSLYAFFGYSVALKCFPRQGCFAAAGASRISGISCSWFISSKAFLSNKLNLKFNVECFPSLYLNQQR